MFDFWTFFHRCFDTFLFLFLILKRCWFWSGLNRYIRREVGIDQNWGMGQLAKMRYKSTFLRAAFYVYDASSSNFSGRANVYSLASDSRRHSTHRLSDEFHFCSRKTNETVPGDTCDTSTTPLLESLSWTKRTWNCKILLQIDLETGLFSSLFDLLTIFFLLLSQYWIFILIISITINIKFFNN